MSFRLKEGVFKVKCREPGCPFFTEFVVKENIMGATEADVDSEAVKIARNMAYIKHDALYGRTHALTNPEVIKITGSYVQLGAGLAAAPAAAPTETARAPGGPTRTYKPGEIIIHKGESAVTVCEVLRGSAHNEKIPDLVYMAGSTFGAAAIFRHKNRLADIVAGSEGATVAFYNIRELNKTNPSKARELYDEAMEDIFHVVQYLEEYSVSLEKQVKKLEAAQMQKKAAPAVSKPKAKKPASRKKPAQKKSKPKTAKKPTAKKPTAKKPTAKKPRAKRPRAKKPTAKKRGKR